MPPARPPEIVLSQAAATDFAAVERFYEACGYGGGAVHRDDHIVLAQTSAGIVGIGRLSRERGVLCLRGMQVVAPLRGQGIGACILRSLSDAIDGQPCWCLPYAHLERFYGSGGFVTCNPHTLPSFLHERLAGYRDRGLQVIAMRRRAQ